MNSLEALNWRYATKTFDPARKLSADQLHLITEALRLSASSYGLQPWKFVVVENQELRQKIQGIAWNQAQVTDASHLLVLCRAETVTAENVERYVDSIVKARGVEASSLDGYKGMMLGAVNGMSEDQKAVWASKQVYLALGTLLTVCADNQIDACPMEGFNPTECDAILDLPAKGLRSVLLCPVGFRSADDKYAEAAKVRFPSSEVVITIQ